MKILASILATSLGAAALIVVPSAAAHASVAQCTTTRNFPALNRPGATVVLPTTSSGSATCFLAEGDNSSAVSALQRALRACNGYPNLAVDGDFGPNTKNAVLGVQNAPGMTRDGVYGPQTRDHMSWTNAAGTSCDDPVL
jgi:peptidoglycan hydrolase-like protein with peptidoglycan-binding domain